MRVERTMKGGQLFSVRLRSYPAITHGMKNVCVCVCVCVRPVLLSYLQQEVIFCNSLHRPDQLRPQREGVAYGMLALLGGRVQSSP